MLGVIVVMGGSLSEIVGYVLLATLVISLIFGLLGWILAVFIKTVLIRMDERRERWVREYEASNKRVY